MSVTVIFVFSDQCGACTYFKENLYNEVMKTFTKLGAKTLEFTAATLQGFVKGQAPYAFLEEINMFPCLICVKSSILEKYSKGELTEDILNRLYIWNGTTVPAGAHKRIVSINPQIYGILPQDFERYYKDFLASPAYLNEIKSDAAVHSREANLQKVPRSSPRIIPTPSYTAHKTGIYVLHGCSGYRAVPIQKK